MRKFSITVAFLALFVAKMAFAHMDDLSNTQCDTIAQACKTAGFTSEGTDDKSFWFGCMKPVLYGKTVSGVTVDAKDVKACRKAKIAKMQKEIKDLQAVK